MNERESQLKFSIMRNVRQNWLKNASKRINGFSGNWLWWLYQSGEESEKKEKEKRGHSGKRRAEKRRHWDAVSQMQYTVLDVLMGGLWLL